MDSDDVIDATEYSPVDMLELRSNPAYGLGYQEGWDDAPRGILVPPKPRRDRLGLVAVSAAAAALILTGIVIGRASAAPRAAPVIPAVHVETAGREPDRKQPGAPRAWMAIEVLEAEVTRVAADRAAGVGAPLPSPASDPGPAPSAGGIGSPLQGVRGLATWYCCTAGHPSGLYAAAGPALRVGHWRDRVVTVCAPGGCVRVRLIDWCLCGHGRVIDLYPQAFRRLAPLRAGVVGVTVSWGGEPPATDTEP